MFQLKLYSNISSMSRLKGSQFSGIRLNPAFHPLRNAIIPAACNIFVWSTHLGLDPTSKLRTHNAELFFMPRDLPTSLVYARRWPLFGRLAYYSLKLLGVELPLSVPVGDGFELVHGGVGVVVHSRSRIGNRVKMYPGVTLGRADIHRPMERSHFEGIVIEDDVILAPGAKILCKEGILVVRRGAVIGANAVLLESTGENEIWAGVPARCIGPREL
jgi:serine O-acetyltransferase